MQFYTQDINNLTISGHVNQQPQLQGDPGARTAYCEFVLTHTSHFPFRGGWQQQHYTVTAHDRVAEAFVENHLPGQVIVITGELDLQLTDTLIGTLPCVSIVAHRIITVDGRLNPAAAATAPTVPIAQLQQTAIGPVPHTRDR